MNNLLDLNFLGTSYIDFLKDLSFIVAMVGGITVGLYLASRLFVINGSEDNLFVDIFISLAAFAGIVLMIVLSILIMAILMLPACYLSALLKDFIVERYFSMGNLTPFKELCINLLCAVICAGLYVKLFIRAFKNM